VQAGGASTGIELADGDLVDVPFPGDGCKHSAAQVKDGPWSALPSM